MDLERFEKQIDFIVEIDKAKKILRNTILMDASRKENDAEHSWHMAVGAMILSEYANDKDLNMLKVLKMILLHDIVEIDAGDTFVYANVDWEEKAEEEKRAAQRIFGLLPNDQADEYRDIWNEFERRETSEAKFAHAMDRFMPILHNYKTNGLQWKRLGVSKEQVLTRNRKIEDGSSIMWSYIESMVDDAVKKDYLKA